MLSDSLPVGHHLPMPIPIAPLLSSAALDAYFDQEHDWLYLDWKGPQELTQVQACCYQVSELMRQTGVHKILNDNTHLANTSWEMVKWVLYHYLPQAGRAGLNYVAWVASPLLECSSYAHLLPHLHEQKPQIAVFDDLAAAYAWLETANVLVKRG